MALCGKPTRRGEPCQFRLSGGKCPTHDTDLSKRNAAVARAFKANNPEGFASQRRAAGRRGYLATGARQGWARANEMARQWRKHHPSGPERWALAVLESASLNHFEREYDLGDGYSVDLAWPDAKRAVEIWGHQNKPSFGETEPRAAKQERKLIALEESGWRILVIDPTQDREAEAARLIAFARASQPENSETENSETEHITYPSPTLSPAYSSARHLSTTKEPTR